MPFTNAISITRLATACAALVLAGCAGPAEPPLIQAKLLSCPSKPLYPREALRNKWTGTTALLFQVGQDGLVRDVKISRSSGHDILDNAALALGQCRFTPATRGGKPLASWQPIQFVWTLQ